MTITSIGWLYNKRQIEWELLRRNCWKENDRNANTLSAQRSTNENSNFETHAIWIHYGHLFLFLFLFLFFSCFDKFNLSKKGNVLQMIRMYFSNNRYHWRIDLFHVIPKFEILHTYSYNNGIAFYIVFLTQISGTKKRKCFSKQRE